MKRIFAVLFMLMFLFIPSAFAGQPDISSDSQTLTLRELRFKRARARGLRRPRYRRRRCAGVPVSAGGSCTGQYQPYRQATGIHFDCDSVEVKGNERTAYVNGNMVFTQDNLRITADNGSFNWKTKNAVSPGTLPLTHAARRRFNL